VPAYNPAVADRAGGAAGPAGNRARDPTRDPTFEPITDMPDSIPVQRLWQCGKNRLDLARPQVMGIVNVTPDSFSDGGRLPTAAAAVEHALGLIEAGADLLDIGGESTRPGADEVAAEEELRRVLPVLRGLRDAPVPLSVDTSKPQVMRAALDEGASVINDVFALRRPGALQCVAGADCGIVLMHMQGSPRTMQSAPHYGDVVHEVREFLRARRDAAEAAGVARARIVLDPGFGFGKAPSHNLRLLARLAELCDLGCPLLAGWSRKATLGVLTGRPVEARVHASVAAALLAVQRGARIVRVHDVAATVDALKVWQAVADYAGGRT
jgi:dihydropteroate synthase